MNGLAFLENINTVIDDDLIFEAENWVRPKAHSSKYIVDIAIVAACLCLTIGLSLGLSDKKDPIKIDNSIGSPMSENDIEQSEPLAFFAPDLFESFKDFEEHEKKAETNAVSFYYVPSSIPSGFELTQIAKRDNIYVAVTYSISDAAMSSIDAQEYAGLNSYDSSRLQTLICERSLFPDGHRSLETDFIANGYEPIEYEGRTYYRWDEHAENDPEKRVIGYELAFLDDDTLIFMHLPAIDTFEYMMRYANVEKVEIN